MAGARSCIPLCSGRGVYPGPVGQEGLLLPSSLLRAGVSVRPKKMQRYVRLIAHHSTVMPRRDVENVSGFHLDHPPVIHRRGRPPGDHHAHVLHSAALRPRRAPHTDRPFPSRLIRRPSDRHPAQPHPHPLIREIFLTDHKDLFIERMGRTINVSQRHDQLSLDFYRMHLERVETDPQGLFRFFPFVVEPRPSEPKTIEINPMVGLASRLTREQVSLLL